MSALARRGRVRAGTDARFHDSPAVVAVRIVVAPSVTRVTALAWAAGVALIVAPLAAVALQVRIEIRLSDLR